KFTGTVLFVSHDRYFIDGLATRVFEVEAGRVHIYPGNYEDYLWRKQGGPEKVAASLAQETKVEAPVAVAPAPMATVVTTAAVKRLNPIKLRQLEERLEFAEAEIPRLESAIAAAEEKLGVFTTAEDAQRNAAELDGLREQRTALMAEWEELAMTLEEQATAQ
ncbi:MAG TPA: ABC transporter ATP-binding protein, partial [Granulicella sp.]|nr:ABC transporter ATP-binding protein [Granulicella sp.]